MPWKGEKDPYKIWLSEIILQQTRVEQGWAYYEKFVKTFPTIQDLAKAKDEKVYKLWEGLGYYNRCKNLIYTARQIVAENNGIFPSDYPSLLALKGIGPYTAAAIASFAYNLPYAVVDGNVFRVFSRFYGIEIPIDSKEGIDTFNKVADQNLSKLNAGIYNQALMDFGATICKPMAPSCSSCIMQKKCVAFLDNKVNQLPIKSKSIQKKKRHFDFFCFTYKGKWLIQKRSEGDIWSGLYQFYLIENTALPIITSAYLKQVCGDQLGIKPSQIAEGFDLKASDKTKVSIIYHQTLTHQLLQARFIKIELEILPSIFTNASWVNTKQMSKFPFPKIINDFLTTQFEKWA